MNIPDQAPEMTKPEAQSSDDGDSSMNVLDLLQGIKSGEITAKAVSPKSRRECVAYLQQSGRTRTEIAKLFDCSERTIQRDEKAICAKNAVSTSPEFTREMVGRLVQQAESSRAYLARLARDANTPHAARVDAERNAFQVVNEMVGRLQDLGYLPSASRHLTAKIHHYNERPTLADVSEELARLASIGVAVDGIGALQTTVDHAQKAFVDSQSLPRSLPNGGSDATV
ncbi:MAG: hypothetical protein AAF662_05365 [Pseudomonadota bacterium]